MTDQLLPNVEKRRNAVQPRNEQVNPRLLAELILEIRQDSQEFERLTLPAPSPDVLRRPGAS